MNLWLLRPAELEADESVNPWEPWYDKMFALVVRASTEQIARQFAAEEAGDEGEHAWLSSNLSTCELLEHDGEPGVVVRDYASA